MTDRKTKTTKLPKGGDYAYVADRLKEFRQDCPNGLIITTPTLTDDTVMFQVRILKDKAKPESAEATGTAFNKLGQPKVFEKTETQALGRALALLGYLASGEIASADEMEQYEEFKQARIDEVIGNIKNIDNINELKTYFISLGNLMANADIIKAKDEQKAALSEAA